MGYVAVNVTSVVQQIVVRRRLALLMQFGCPIIECDWVANEFPCGNDSIGVKSRQKELPVEAIHSPAEPYQAIENVLPLEQMFEPGQPFGCNSWVHQSLLS
jgi:hypothetical protein